MRTFKVYDKPHPADPIWIVVVAEVMPDGQEVRYGSTTQLRQLLDEIDSKLGDESQKVMNHYKSKGIDLNANH